MGVNRSRPELHPGAWWVWALAMAAAASRTTNPLLLGTALAVAGLVVVSCRRPDRSLGFGPFLRLGLAVLLIRTVFHLLLGSVGGEHELFALPRIPLPGWAAGIQLGGPVYADGLLLTFYDALRLATLLCCVGVAAVLASPRRLLDRLPGALYEVGVTVVVGMSLAPELVASAGRVRRARELRGDAGTGRGPVARARGWARIVLPVFADATDHALALAASMDGRGYGRNRTLPRRERWTTAALVLTGLAGLCLGMYSLLAAPLSEEPADDNHAPLVVTVIALAAGVVATVLGLMLGSRRVHRTRLISVSWTMRDLGVLGAGLAALVASIVADAVGVGLDPVDVAVPALPLLPFVGLLVAALPAWTARS